MAAPDWDFSYENFNFKETVQSQIFGKRNFNYECPSICNLFYTCKACGDRFYLKSSYQDHMNRTSVLIEHNCKVCEKKYNFTNNCSLIDHMQSHINNFPIVISDNLEVKLIPNTHLDLEPLLNKPEKNVNIIDDWEKFIEKTPKIKLPINERITKTAIIVPEKISSSVGLNSDTVSNGVCRISSTTPPLLVPIVKAKCNKTLPLSFTCTICKIILTPKNYESLEVVKRDHYQKIVGESPYVSTCYICKKSMPNMCSLAAHSTLHRSSPPFICPECGSVMKTLEMLEQHIVYKCFHYSKVLYVKCLVSDCADVLSYEGYRNHFFHCHFNSIFSCTICNYKTTTARNMRSHFDIIHTETENLRSLVGFINTNPAYECLICREMVELKDRNKHLEDHQRLAASLIFYYSCPGCKNIHKTISDFRTHLDSCNAFMKITLQRRKRKLDFNGKKSVICQYCRADIKSDKCTMCEKSIFPNKIKKNLNRKKSESEKSDEMETEHVSIVPNIEKVRNQIGHNFNKQTVVETVNPNRTKTIDNNKMTIEEKLNTNITDTDLNAITNPAIVEIITLDTKNTVNIHRNLNNNTIIVQESVDNLENDKLNINRLKTDINPNILNGLAASDINTDQHIVKSHLNNHVDTLDTSSNVNMITIPIVLKTINPQLTTNLNNHMSTENTIMQNNINPELINDNVSDLNPANCYESMNDVESNMEKLFNGTYCDPESDKETDLNCFGTNGNQELDIGGLQNYPNHDNTVELNQIIVNEIFFKPINMDEESNSEPISEKTPEIVQPAIDPQLFKVVNISQLKNSDELDSESMTDILKEPPLMQSIENNLLFENTSAQESALEQKIEESIQPIEKIVENNFLADNTSTQESALEQNIEEPPQPIEKIVENNFLADNTSTQESALEQQINISSQTVEKNVENNVTVDNTCTQESALEQKIEEPPQPIEKIVENNFLSDDSPTQEIEIFTCRACSFDCINSTQFSNHIKTHRTSESPFQCVSCGICYKRREELLLHLKENCVIYKPFVSHDIIEILDSDDENVPTPPKRDSKATFFDYNTQRTCVKCKVTVNTVSEFRTHIIENHEVTNAYMCMECGNCFTTEHSLTIHLSIAHSISNAIRYIRRFKCYNANNTLEDIKSPLDLIKDEVYPCTICTETFDDSADLDKHFRTHGMAFLLKNTKNIINK